MQRPAPVGLGPMAVVSDDKYALARFIVVVGDAVRAKDARIGESLAAMFDVNSATGVMLDIVGYRHQTPRLVALPAKMTALVIGIGGQAIGGVLVKDAQGFQWQIDTASIAAGGSSNVTATATVVGPAVVYAVPYTKVTALAGLTQYIGVALSSNGRLYEEDADYRARIKLARSTRGGVEYAWDKRIRELVPGVVSSRSTMNRTGSAVNGIPPHHGEAVVRGGTDIDVARVLLIEAASATAGFWGNTTVSLAHPQDPALGSVSVMFSRGNDIRGWISVTVVTTGAPNPQVWNVFSRQIRVLIAQWTQTLIEGQIPLLFALSEYVADRVPVGSIVSMSGFFSRDNVTYLPIIALSKYESFKASAVAMPAIIIGTVVGPYALSLGWQLHLKKDAGATQVITFTGTETTIALVVARIVAAALTEIVASESASHALRLETTSTGLTTSLSVEVTSTPALLAALGLIVGSTLGSVNDIGVVAV